ncbi:prenyltransferase/squalene oxidase repeat-containing protein [Prosthecobacter sp.]|uniref:prenyltransferase/squalene oxidase repeat-containing protein n=1 Tax=Prosthecobacter sp. TaxID=1965333 RepID=UPI002ABC6798|nr:prenyltransferase/squalene oxidase repeat-containing protein [Prosthecobacter sp.]MDZ4404498.1 prenyltransferase/squalene oxidase repeat-containing protein [Prosthecobacter sp.]
MKVPWNISAAGFFRSLLSQGEGLASSKPGGPITLYGTCYAILGLHFLGEDEPVMDNVRRFVTSAQDSESGLLIGPELVGFEAAPGVMHDRGHLLMHLTCSVLPFCQQFSIQLKHPIFEAHKFCDQSYLEQWMKSRNWRHAWFEGNNILFVGQLLVYLRDTEMHPGAGAALDSWFQWLDRTMDPATGLWGTNGFCSPMEAVYGGYHQLLVYYHQNHLLPHIRGLVDTVLKLQHYDGGFNPNGNAGACEDVDSVDILIHCYKRLDYRRAEIRHALRRCLRHILATQNPDGGFPYSRDWPQTHMGIPGTDAAPNVSCSFPTWFRIHTLALIAEVLPGEPALHGVPFRFSNALGMGWHQSPDGWSVVSPAATLEERVLEGLHQLRIAKHCGRNHLRTIKRAGLRVLSKTGLSVGSSRKPVSGTPSHN